MALQHTNLVQPATWVGLDNFRAVLHDPLLPIAVRNTAVFAGLALLFGYPVPLVAAVLMSEVRRLRGVYSALAYLPVVVPPVVAVLLWKTFYNGDSTGVFNTILGWVGLGPYPWLQSAHTAMPSLVLESTWANAGGTVIIYLAALTGVNSELYEAAAVDGASLWRKIWHITLPQLRGVLLVTMILQIIGTAQVLLLIGLVVVGLGPLLWLAKSAITPTADTISHPMSLFAHGAAWRNLREAWSNVEVGRYFWNTVVLAIGSWCSQIFVATTAG